MTRALPVLSRLAAVQGRYSRIHNRNTGIGQVALNVCERCDAVHGRRDCDSRERAGARDGRWTGNDIVTCGLPSGQSAIQDGDPTWVPNCLDPGNGKPGRDRRPVSRVNDDLRIAWKLERLDVCPELRGRSRLALG